MVCVLDVNARVVSRRQFIKIEIVYFQSNILCYYLVKKDM